MTKIVVPPDRGTFQLAVVLDGGGRFVQVTEVPPNTGRLVAWPWTPEEKAINEKLGLVADRTPKKWAQRFFRKRGVVRTPQGCEVIIFKEESAG